MNTNNDDPFESAFGKIGESVPVVDADDIRAVSREYRQLAKDHPGEQFGVSRNILATVCKPGADMSAVCYRHMSVSILPLIVRTPIPAEAKPDAEFLEFQRKI